MNTGNVDVVLGFSPPDVLRDKRKEIVSQKILRIRM